MTAPGDSAELAYDESRAPTLYRRRADRDPAGRAASAAMCATLRQRRIALGRGRKAVASMIAVGATTVWSWEAGQREPALSHAMAWARALGVEIVVNLTEERA